MEKLDKIRTTILARAVNTARALNIEAFAITGGVVKGMSNSGMLIVDTVDDTDFNIAVTRVQTLYTRLSMMREAGEFEINFTTKNDEYINKLFFKAKRTTAEFNCAKPAVVKAPVRLADKKLASFNITPDTLAVLRKAASAMGSTSLSFSISEDSVIVKLIDDSGDAFAHTITDSTVTTTENYTGPVSFAYNLKNFLQTLKDTGENEEVSVTIRGFLECKYEGFTVYLSQEII